MKISRFFLCLLLLVTLDGYSQKHLLVKVKNTSVDKAILYAVRGASTEALDTANKHLGTFAFAAVDKYPCGVYQIKLEDSLTLDLILNQENVSIETDAKDLVHATIVHESLENKILNDYHKYAIAVRDSVVRIQKKIQLILKENQQKEDTEILALDKKLSDLNKQMELYAYKQASLFPNAFAPKLLVAFQLPSYQLFLEQGNEPYPNEELFYLYHFFDNIDFTDERLLNSKVLYVTINDYIQTFGGNGSTEIYTDIADKVLSKANANAKIHRYAINLFIETFETSIYEKVYYHIIENHLLPCDCFYEGEKAYYRKSLATSKALAIGKTMPDIQLNDVNGKQQSLYQTPANIKLVIFWNSGCEHCHEMLPTVKNAFDAYREAGFIVYAVAIEESAESWQKDINRFGLQDMIHVSDLMGMGSPLVEQFNVWSTPMMYLLDRNNKILSKPNSSAELYQTLIVYQQKH